MELGDQARFIFHTLAEAGYECFLVGGSVRDRLLGRDDADLDFTTNARPDDLLRLFPGSHYPNRFGTVLVDLGSRQYEITTYRGEGRYSDHRHPDHVAFVDRLEDDLGRRDFTINALAMDATGRIVDPFDGRGDLDRRLIRAVGDPAERLAEDPLRMMRAVRLAAQLDLRIDRPTRRAIARYARLLAMISRERIRDELLKILASQRALHGYDLLDQLGLLPAVLPGLTAAPADARAHARRALRHSNSDPLLRLAALLHVLAERSALVEQARPGEGVAELGGDAGEPLARAGGTPALPAARTQTGSQALPAAGTDAGRDAVRRELVGLRLSGAELARVAGAVDALRSLSPDLVPEPAAARRLLSGLGPLLPDALALARAHRLALGPMESAGLAQLGDLRRLADRARRERAPTTIGDLALSGDDLIAGLGLAPGPVVGRLLRLLLDRVLVDPSLNRSDALLQIARAELAAADR